MGVCLGRRMLDPTGSRREKREKTRQTQRRDLVFPEGLINFIFIVSELGTNVKEYLDRYGRESPALRHRCPTCERLMHRHGCFFRWLWQKRGPCKLPIYRQLCPDCLVAVSLFPVFLKPYHRCCLSDLESLLEDYVQGVSIERLAEEAGVEILTMRRWLRRVAGAAPAHLLWLAREILFMGSTCDPTRLTIGNRRGLLGGFLLLARRFCRLRAGDMPWGFLLVFNLVQAGDW